jgi:hypothetical protein
VLGKRIDDPRCFSLNSVGLKIGIRQERILNTLIEIDPAVAQANKLPRYLSKDQVTLLKARFEDDISIDAAAKLMGCTYSHVSGFIKVGMIKRYSNGADAEHLSAKEVRAFVEPIMKIEPIGQQSRFVPITEIYAHTRRTICETYQSFLDGNLKKLNRIENEIGVASLMVNPDEVLAVLSRGDVHSGMRICDFIQRHCINSGMLRHLVKQTLLDVVKVRDPVSRGIRRHVTKDSLDAFDKHFVCIRHLSKVTGIGSQRLKKIVLNAYIKPIFCLPDGKEFFSVAEVYSLPLILK